MYDQNNIFARILRGEIPAQVVKETPYTLAFRDIAPKAPFHILVIPKGAYITAGDFFCNASTAELEDFARTVGDLLKDREGYRLISNNGAAGGQEVPHFHLHLLSGQPTGNFG